MQRGSLLLKGEIVDVLKCRDEVKYGILWEYPSGAGWGAESEEDIEPAGNRVEVPRVLLEEVLALLNYFDGMQPSRNQSLGACRAAIIHALLETK